MNRSNRLSVMRMNRSNRCPALTAPYLTSCIILQHPIWPGDSSRACLFLESASSQQPLAMALALSCCQSSGPSPVLLPELLQSRMLFGHNSSFLAIMPCILQCRGQWPYPLSRGPLPSALLEVNLLVALGYFATLITSRL